MREKRQREVRVQACQHPSWVQPTAVQLAKCRLLNDHGQSQGKNHPVELSSNCRMLSKDSGSCFRSLSLGMFCYTGIDSHKGHEILLLYNRN